MKLFLPLLAACANAQLFPWQTPAPTTGGAVAVTTTASPAVANTTSSQVTVTSSNVTLDDESVLIKDQCTSGHIDRTVTPGAYGEIVARTTYTKVLSKFTNFYKLNDDDRGFFLRYSYAEGKYGAEIFDYYNNVQQIWPISEAQFELTKEFFLQQAINDIKTIFGIEWNSVKYQELNVPTYSAIAFFLYMDAIEAWPIPWSIEGQGKLYEKITSKPMIQWTTFMGTLNGLEEEVCRNEAVDLVFLVDHSGSIGEPNALLITDFITGIVSGLNVAENNTRVAVRTFEKTTNLKFSLKDYDQDLVAKSSAISYDCADRSKCLTYTNIGISDVLENDFTSAAGMRAAAKKVLVVITDGKSTFTDLTNVQAARLHADARNIQVVAIGVAGAEISELNKIATSNDQVFFLENFSAFADVKEQISNSICNAPIVGGNGNNIDALVARGTNANGVSGIVPGFVHLKLEMQGRTQIQVKSTGAASFFMSYNNTYPSPAHYDFTFDVDYSKYNVVIKINVSVGTEVVYMSAYNYADVASSISVDIVSVTTAATPLPVPIPCGLNAYCAGAGKCVCHDGYIGNPNKICRYNLCNNVKCADQETCNVNTGTCECREGYSKVDGKCLPPLCPSKPVIATENQFGYAMGEISSPFYGMDNYPQNFDCEYAVEAPRAPDSCYEIHIENPFSLETSRACSHDRLELYNVQNAGVITMDHEFTRAMGGTTAVLCGDACIADGGWIGRVCGNQLRFRFKSDEIITSTGWKIKWILRPQEECDCWCNN